MHHSDGGLTLSYNAQISADAAHGLIVGVAVTQEVNDCRQLLPAVDRLEARLKKKPQQMVADTGYTTRETIEAMAERQIGFLGSMVEEKKRGRPALERFPPTAFVFDQERDCFIFVPRVSCSAMKGATRKRKALRITATKQSGGIAKAVPASPSVVRKIRSKAARWFAAKKVRPCLPFIRRWPAKKRKRSTAAVGGSWNFVTHGSK